MIHPDSDTLEKFFDRELSDEQNVSVERHVAICSECRDFLVGSQMTRTLLESSPLPTQSESFVHSVMEKVRDSEHQRFAFQIRNFLNSGDSRPAVSRLPLFSSASLCFEVTRLQLQTRCSPIVR